MIIGKVLAWLPTFSKSSYCRQPSSLRVASMSGPTTAMSLSLSENLKVACTRMPWLGEVVAILEAGVAVDDDEEETQFTQRDCSKSALGVVAWGLEQVSTRSRSRLVYVQSCCRYKITSHAHFEHRVA